MEELEQLLQRLRIASPKGNLVLYATPTDYVIILDEVESCDRKEIKHPRLRECVDDATVPIRQIIEKKIAALETSAEVAASDLRRAREALAEITPLVSPPPALPQ